MRSHVPVIANTTDRRSFVSPLERRRGEWSPSAGARGSFGRLVLGSMVLAVTWRAIIFLTRLTEDPFISIVLLGLVVATVLSLATPGRERGRGR